jgi:ATP-dependent DNA ligase
MSGSLRKPLQVAQQFDLEGFIAKKPDSVHESGRRSGTWVKFKTTIGIQPLKRPSRSSNICGV